MERVFCTCGVNPWCESLKNVCGESIFRRPMDLQSAALPKIDLFCWCSMGFLYLCALVIIRGSHREVFYRNACPTTSCPTTHLLCTCGVCPKFSTETYDPAINCSYGKGFLYLWCESLV